MDTLSLQVPVRYRLVPVAEGERLTCGRCGCLVERLVDHWVSCQPDAFKASSALLPHPAETGRERAGVDLMTARNLAVFHSPGSSRGYHSRPLQTQAMQSLPIEAADYTTASLPAWIGSVDPATR